jgi:hypothetical protein
MYCTVQNVKNILPNNVTVGDINIGTPVPGRPDVKRSQLSTDDIIEFIKLAQQEINARLRPMYVCPLRRVKIHETGVLNNVSTGTTIKISVNDTGQFAKGQLIRLQSKSDYEEVTITSIPNLSQMIVDKVISLYDSESLVSILEFPDPIPLTTARLAASYAYDRLFSAEQAPDVSNYGQEQRKRSMFSIDSILTGTVILMGQEHVTKRFARMSIFDSFKTPTDDISFGRESQ